jgi:hypothetical protein
MDQMEKIVSDTTPVGDGIGYLAAARGVAERPKASRDGS